MTPRFVLDAWAMLALLQGEEPAAARVKALLAAAELGEVELSMSIINLGKVVYRIGKSQGEEAAWETLDQIRRLSLAVIPASEEAVWAAVRFKIPFAISYADAFAAAAAAELKATLVTGDPELLALAAGLPVERLERFPAGGP
jgi:predicted nucleic acid-binding protein